MFCDVFLVTSEYDFYLALVYCTIDEFIKGAASLRRYGITFDDNINIMYMLMFIFSVKRTYLENIRKNH
jgi:hypothetical protein